MDQGKLKANEDLIERYQQGDHAAFDQLIKEHGTSLYNFIFYMTKSKSLADDIYQETWSRVINHLDSYHEQGKFKCWLFKIANHQCLNHLRLVRRFFVPLTEILKTENEADIFISESNFNSRPDEELESNERLQWVRKLAHQLPIKQRQVFLLKMNSDLTFKEISVILNRPLNTVLTQMRTAMLTIRKKLKDIYGEL
ncbi:MAG: sigma-70 family RNA polymerase sigma factor [candidate division KSB1 bacterium]|nr:sigma-70 family RNA polymerase sigma factor [candidate division KSB1 bacterium]